MELEKVDSRIFQTTQNIGKEIGMTTLEELGKADSLPNGEEADFDISYHMALLDFYGITYLNDSASMKHILLGVLVIIMGICALLIYSVFSLSFMEKKKYIGLLSCVGASLWLRRLFVFGEGLMIGLISVPLGIIAGCFGSVYAIGILREKLNEAYMLHLNPGNILDVKITILAALLGALTIVIAVLVPTVQAGKVNALDLIFKVEKVNQTESIGKYYPRYSLPFNMALRNLNCNRQKCLKILFFVAFSIVVAFNGYISIQEMQRKYLLQDERESKPLDAWVRVYSDDFTLGEQIKEKINKMSWSKEVSYLSILDLGAFTIDKKYVAKDLEKFKLSWWQTENPVQFSDQEGKNYGFPLKIVGIDDESFLRYLALSGEEWEKGVDTYPVIIDDYITVQKDGEEYAKYREVLSIRPGEEVSIQFGTYADYFLNQPNTIVRTKSEQTILHVCASTSNRVPLPIMPGAYGMEKDDYT